MAHLNHNMHVQALSASVLLLKGMQPMCWSNGKISKPKWTMLCENYSFYELRWQKHEPFVLNVTPGKYVVWLTIGFMVSDMHKPICRCNSFIVELCIMWRDPQKVVMVLLKFASAIAYQVIISGEGGGEGGSKCTFSVPYLVFFDCDISDSRPDWICSMISL